MSNLPKANIQDSANQTKQFFDQYYVKTVSFTANEIDAVTGFFRKRGFDEVSAISISTVLLTQARIDNIKPFRLLDTLKGLNPVQLNAVIAEVLNYNRQKISSLGFKTETSGNIEARNIGDLAPAQETVTYVDSAYVEPGYVI